MMVRFLISILPLLVLGSAAAASSVPEPTAVKEMMQRVTDYMLQTEVAQKKDCGWERGAFFAGHMSHYRLTQNQTLAEIATAWGTEYDWEACNYPKTLSEHAAANDYINLATYAHLYAEVKQDPVYLANAEKIMLEVVERSAVDDYWWIDAFFMGLPTFAALGNITGNAGYSRKMYQLYNNTAVNRSMWDAGEGLFYRDQTYIGKLTPGGKKIFWARGNSWAIAGLTRALTWLPNDPNKADYLSKIRAMAGALAKVQRPDGFWEASLIDLAECPFPETTGTAGLTYGLAAGVNRGWLDRDTYLPVVLKAWNGMSTIAVNASGHLGWCQPVGGGPKNATATDTSDFCVGLFLLAASEVAQL